MAERLEIGNSFVLTFDRVVGSRTVSIGLWTDVGSRDENENQIGYCHFVEHMLFKGTNKRSYYDIAMEIDNVGGEINGATDKEHTYFYTNISSEDYKIGLEILSDIFINPSFNPIDLDKEKSVIIDEIDMIEDNPDDFVYELYSRTMWRNNSLGNPVVGTKDIILKSNRDDIKRFYDEYFKCGKVVLSVAGGIEKDEILKSIDVYFGSLLKNNSYHDIRPKKRIKPAFHPSISMINRNVEQIYCVMGTESFPSNDERRYSLYLLNIILGASFSSRFFQKIREKLGLCYSISTSNTGYSDTGEFSINFTTSKKNLSLLLAALKDEMTEVILKGVKEDELERAKKRFRGNYILSMDNNEWRMARMAYQELMFGKLITYEETLKKIEEIDLEDINSLAKSLFRKGFVVASIGPRGHGRVFNRDGFFID